MLLYNLLFFVHFVVVVFLNLEIIQKYYKKWEKVTSYVVERYKVMWCGTQQFVEKTLRKVRKEKKGGKI